MSVDAEACRDVWWPSCQRGTWRGAGRNLPNCCLWETSAQLERSPWVCSLLAPGDGQAPLWVSRAQKLGRGCRVGKSEDKPGPAGQQRW